MNVLLTGIAPEHGAALIAGLAAALTLATRRSGSRSTVDRWAAGLLAYAAGVHLMLLFGHGSGTMLTIGYLASATGFGVLAWRAHLGRGWRIGTAILAPMTVLAYLISGEDADQVGILTVLLELTAFGLAVATTRRVGRVFGAIGTVLAVLLAGAVIWVESFTAHQATSSQAQDPSVGHSHDGGHQHLARAQAGVIMRPLADDHSPTPEQAAALDLAEKTSAAMRQYARLADAIADGYEFPVGNRTGMHVHLEHKRHRKDGRVLDPDHPEMLVYAIADGRATLLGVVYVMERAGEPGVASGGSITRWHAHNLCVSLAPPGIGIVSPYGGCPSFSVAITIPEMMHVWIVPLPGGPFAEGLDEEWAREYHRNHGQPV